MNSMETAVVTTEQEINSIPPAMHHDPESARRDLAAWDALHREEKHVLQERHSYFYTAGRLLLGALFLAMAYAKMAHFSGTVTSVAVAGYGDASILVGIALLLELVGGLMLALGWQVRIAARGLIAYLVLVTVLLNWDQSLATNRALALANFGFIAALLLLTAHGAGGASLERTLAKRRAQAAKA
jgi:putative oxidoreductase